MLKGRPETVRFASAWLSSEEAAGRTYGPLLLALPTARWRSEINRDANLRRYGTLRFVLDEIHDQLYDFPAAACERSAVIVEYVGSADIPNENYRSFIGGYAWKVYANALRSTGDHRSALAAARTSQTIFHRVGSFASEASKARLVEGLVLREMGELDSALAIAKECASIFRDHEDAEAYMQARMTEALVLADTKRHHEALVILQEAAEDAERRGDKRTLAICLHNSAEYARALGDRVMARELDALSLIHFEELGSTVEKPSIRWTQALALADEGKVSAAILQLYVTRSEFLALGKNSSAADVGLDIVRLRHERGEDVTAECVELVETFTRAGMIQPAIEALAYLREQARNRTISGPKIVAVRDFVRETAQGPARLFVPPPEDGT